MVNGASSRVPRRGKCTKLSGQLLDPKDRDICNKCFDCSFRVQLHSSKLLINE